MKRTLVLSMLLAVGASAHATLLTFEDLAVGATLGNQYAGIHFAIGLDGAVGVSASSSGLGWATNSAIDITEVGGDVGGLGTPNLVSGHLVRSFGGWLSEDGDPVINVKFDNEVTDFSLDFAGVATPADTRIFALNASKNVVASKVGTVTTGQFNLALNGLTGVKEIIITPGSFNDWVGFDNVNYTVKSVPEPATLTLLGLAVPFIARRRKSK